MQFILETCRILYNYALKRGHLPPYVGNPFSELTLDRMKIEDARAIFAFDQASEPAFLTRCGPRAFPVHFTPATTGLRVGELTHLLIEDVEVEGRTARATGHVESTCPKSWRHTFATLLQDGNVDPLIRRQVLGHRPRGSGRLRMTANYTPTRPETRRRRARAGGADGDDGQVRAQAARETAGVSRGGPPPVAGRAGAGLGAGDVTPSAVRPAWRPGRLHRDGRCPSMG